MSENPSSPPIAFLPVDLDRLDDAPAGHLYLFICEERLPLSGLTGLLDWRLSGAISNHLIEGLFAGTDGERIDVETRNHLPLHRLTLIGMGRRDQFSPTIAKTALMRMLQNAQDESDPMIFLSLPGRSENVCTGDDAMEWFMDALESTGCTCPVVLIDTRGAQQIMLPIVERRQLQDALGI